MAEISDILQPLEVLLASGTVRGTCLLKDGEVIYEKFPYSAARLVKICRVVDGLTKEFKDKGRIVDQMAFGYEGGNLLAISVKKYRLIVMHLMNDEIDFLANVARNCLDDLIADDRENGEDVEEEGEEEARPMKGAVPIDTAPVVLAKDRDVKEGEKQGRVEDTTKVAVLEAPADSSAPPEPSTVPGTAPIEPSPPAVRGTEKDDDSEVMSPENMSLGI